jgi:hypothetical protein
MSTLGPLVIVQTTQSMLLSTYYLFFIINIRRIVRPQNNPAMKTTPTTEKATIIKYLRAGERDT